MKTKLLKALQSLKSFLFVSQNRSQLKDVENIICSEAKKRFAIKSKCLKKSFEIKKKESQICISQ